PEFAGEYSDMDDDTLISVEIGIEDKGLIRANTRAFWLRHARNNCLQDLINPDAFLSACKNRRFSGDRQDILQLLASLGNVRVRQINFVDDRYDGQVLLHGQVDIGDC